MKTNNLIQKISIAGSIILVTFYLVNAQTENKNTLTDKNQVVAYLSHDYKTPNTVSPAVKRNEVVNLEKIAEILLEKGGLTFDVKKTNTVSSLSVAAEKSESLSLEDLNNNLIDTQLRFDPSNTVLVNETNEDFNRQANLDEQILKAEALIKFDVNKTNSVEELNAN